MISKEKVDEAVAVLVKEADPYRIVLFGSFARNEQTPESDIDLLVITKDNRENRFKMATRLRRCLRPLRTPFDILVHDIETINEWSDAVGTIIYTIAQEGKVVYEKQ